MAANANTLYKPLANHIIPLWGKAAADWLKSQSETWKFLGSILSVIMFAVGFSLLVFGGYTSIQIVRLPLAEILLYWDIHLATTGIPAWYWWFIPLGTNFVQICTKAIPGLSRLWYPSIFFDSCSMGIFLSFPIMSIIENLGMDKPASLLLAAFIASVLSLISTICAEKIMLASLPILQMLFDEHQKKGK